MGSAAIQRRRFLTLAAASAAGTVVIACGGSTGSSASPSTPSSAVATAPAVKPTTQPTSQAAIPPQAAPKLDLTSPVAAATVTASKYKEAPTLASLVAASKLPPVEKRLPDNPRVLTPLEEAGEFGGTWHHSYTGLADNLGVGKLLEEFLIEWDAPDPNTIRIIANFAEKWEQSADGTTFTFHLRKGLKWSDGQEVTTDDAKFMVDDVLLNKDLVPAPPFVLRQKVGSKYEIAKVSYPDAYTIQVNYPAPYPLLPIQMAVGGGGLLNGPAFLAPSHYLKQFHAKYTDQTKLDALAKSKGYATWTDLWGKAGNMEGPIAFWFINPDLPVVNPWKVEVAPPSDPMVFVRNPYYWQVDTAGNQLPYIDQINNALYQNAEVLKLWIAGGKIDCQIRGLDAGTYTFLKENEKKGDYRTLSWRAASTDTVFFSLNAPDAVLAKLFDTKEFRQALNLAVNRDELLQIVWNGLGVARQYGPVKGSPEYDEEMTKVWAQYDPKTANDLLDKLSLKKGSDGVRLRPDGKPLEIVVEHMSTPGSPDVDGLSLLKKYWAAIGVKIDLHYEQRALLNQRQHNAEIQACYAFPWARCSVIKADPAIWLGTADDHSWAPAYGHWYSGSPYKQVQPPPDHPIRQIWKLWDQTQVEPDESKRNALFQQLIDVHKAQPFAVGTVGEKVVPVVAKNNFRNIKTGFIQDNTTRDLGLINPQQFFFKTSG
ncbi:MAG TPA: ABC transporter substrate-binding protein [Chloroflexota bacterium]|nr:ABC transporter substrate-binding protein [Chloroflexota bacterium]